MTLNLLTSILVSKNCLKIRPQDNMLEGFKDENSGIVGNLLLVDLKLQPGGKSPNLFYQFPFTYGNETQNYLQNSFIAKITDNKWKIICHIHYSFVIDHDESYQKC